MTEQRAIAYYVPSTHWDREWFQPFEHFRYHLCETMDQVLDTLRDDERYACFQTDGQSIIAEDYLAMRPERREAFVALARTGRLHVGPWYTMPDENLPSGESLIRNLEEGIRVAKEMGNVSRVGFSCDIFGHISQLPQILRGFGIDNTFIWRGTDEPVNGPIFHWESPDGTEILAYTFGSIQGYGEFARVVRSALDPTIPFDVNDALPRLNTHWEQEKKRLGLDAVMLFDGIDHLCIAPQMPDLLARFAKEHPEVEVRHTGLAEFASAMRDRASQFKGRIRGELRTPGKRADINYVIPGVLSSRVKLKQTNHAIETALTRWAEPFAAWSSRTLGTTYPHPFLRRAWRLMLENHAHDSIGGCSPDQVHRDMMFRYDQSRLITGKVTDETLRGMARRVQMDDLAGDDFAVVVFNATQAEIDGPVGLELWFPSDTPHKFTEFFAYENKVGFRLLDVNGQEIPYDYVAHHQRRSRMHRAPDKTPQFKTYWVVRVAARVQVPAFGYTTLLCKPVTEITRHPEKKIAVDERTLENEHLRVSVSDHGMLCIEDKRNGQRYQRAMVFEDRADIGDGWFHGVAVNDRIITSTAAAADVSVVTDGSIAASLRVDVRMRVPAEFDFGPAMSRTSQLREIVMENTITLRRDASHIEVRTRFDNTVKDHRLRVLFASKTQTDTYHADSAFDVVTRDIKLPADNHTYKELAIETASKANWIAVNDKQRGLAIVAPGLPEATVRDTPDRTIALTLVRGFRRTVGTDGEPDGQSLGQHEFEYAIVPFDHSVPVVALNLCAQRLAAPPRAYQVTPTTQAPAEQRVLPRSTSQLRLAPGQASITALRMHPEKDYLEVRMFNPLDEAITESLVFDAPIAQAHATDMEGNPLQELKSSGKDRIEVQLPAKRILTLAVNLSEPGAM